MHILLTTTWNCCRLLPTFLDYHRALGFDRALVIDFGSDDGTRDILASPRYADFVETERFSGLADLDSSNLMLRAAQARHPPSTLCLFCDPDEFLVLGAGRRIADLDLAGSAALLVKRYNMTGLRSAVLADPSSAHPLGCLNLRIAVRHIRSSAETLGGALTSPWIFTRIGPKVIVRLGDAISIGDGDHTAVMRGLPPRPAGPETYLLHYPISTFAAFEERVRLNRLDFAANQALPPQFGWHARRWMRLADENRLWREYIEQFISGDDLSTLQEAQAIATDNSVRDFRQDLSAGAGPRRPPRRPKMNLIGPSVEPSVPANRVAPRTIHVVLGMHRSGTSLCSNILHALGVDMTEDRWSGRGNEHGHWERRAFADVHDAILEHLDRGFHTVNHDLPLPAGWWRMPEIRPYISRLGEMVAAALARSRCLGFKDPRIVKLFPAWAEIFAQHNLQPKYIICLRNPVHVARSLKSRDDLNPLVGEFRWLDYTVDCFRYTTGQAVHVVNYEDWFSDPAGTLDALQAFLNLDVSYRQEDIRYAVEALIRPDENHAAGDRSRPQLPIVCGFYKLARQAVASQDRQQVDAFVEQFVTFRQTLLPFGTKLQQVQAAANEHAQRAAHLATVLEAQATASEYAHDVVALGAKYHEASKQRDDLRRQVADVRQGHARSVAMLRALLEQVRALDAQHQLEPAIRGVLDELFCESWYLEQNLDVRTAGMPALDHYVSHGVEEGRDPHPRWSGQG